MNIFVMGDNLLGLVSLDANDVSAILLLVKITVVIATALTARVLLRRCSAAFRHAVLGMALVAVPVVAVFHFKGPSWALPEIRLGFEIQKPTSMTNSDLRLPEIVATVAGTERAKTDAVGPGERVPNSDNATRPVFSEAVSSAAKPESTNDKVSNLSPIQPVESTAKCGDTIGSGPQVANGYANSIGSGSEIANDSDGRSDRDAVATKRPGWRFALSGIWAIVSSALILRLIWSWRIMSRRVGGSVWLELAPTHAERLVIMPLIEAIVRQGIELRVVRNNSQLPCAFGLLRKTILLPRGCEQWDAGRWQSVLLHESAHFRRHDCWTNLVAGISVALLWWHPLLVWLVHALRIESELACDNQVLQAGVSRIEYAELLLEFASTATGRTIFAASAGMAGSHAIESRLQSVLAANTVRGPLNRSSLLSLWLIAVIGVMPIAAARITSQSNQPTSVKADNPKTTPHESEWLRADAVHPALDQVEALTQTPFDVDNNPALELEAEPIFQITNGSLTIMGKGSFEYAIRTSFGTAIVRSESLSSMEPVDLKTSEYRITTIDGREFTGELIPSGGLRVGRWSIDKPDSIAELSMDHLVRGLGPGEADSQEDAPSGMTICDGDPISIRSIRNAPLVPARISNGRSGSGLSWHLRTPEDYQSGKKYPVLVLLHGKNDNSENYIRKFVTMWPDLAERFLLVGINGEKHANNFDPFAPRYNYSWFNFRGRSESYQALPERESPILVAETIAELRACLPAEKVLLAGHADGGFVAMSVLMNYPESIEGAVIVGGGLPTACQPTGYRNKDLRRLQRARPVVFLHSADDPDHKLDNTISKIRSLERDAFDKVHLIEVPAGGKGFSALPVNEAVEWVDQRSTNKPNATPKTGD